MSKVNKTTVLFILAVILCIGSAHASGTDSLTIAYPKCSPLFNSVLKKQSESFRYELPERSFKIPEKADENLYRLFIPLTLYNSVYSGVFGFQMPDTNIYKAKRHIPQVDSLLTQKMHARSEYNRFMRELSNSALMNMYLTRPDLIYTTEDKLNCYKRFDKNVIKETPPKVKVVSLFTPETNIVDKSEVSKEISLKKPNFWKFTGNGAIQLSQNKFSDNWSYEGESSAYIMSDLLLNINYNDQQHIEFDNKIEFKVGLTSLPSDTIRKYNTSSDLLRITSKFGIKAFSTWFYSLSAEFSTQMLNTYEKNSTTLKTAFMSPAVLSVNLGMDYKIDREKIDLSLMLSPISYQLKYVANEEVDKTATNIGIDPDKKTSNNAGSKVLFNMTWTIIPQIVWTSRLEYFTNYSKIEARLENTFDFRLNRFLSAKFFLDLRYNDQDKDAGYKLQYNELFSFGISYNW